MTQAAVLRKACRRVIRAGCAIEIRQVAGGTGHRESGIHIVFVALGTGSTDMSSRQREWRTGVVERSALPIRR